MKPIIPPRLKQGDEIRIVAPALSLATVPRTSIAIAQKRLTSLGFRISFGKNVLKKNMFKSSSIQDRIEDINDAFSNPNIRMILCATGGYNSNQLLPYLDYALIKQNPKIFCGYSDITAMNNALFAKTGLITYQSPCFSTWGMKKGFEYTQKKFLGCVMTSKRFLMDASEYWSDDDWDKNQNKRIFLPNKGLKTLAKGTAEGTIIGGNLCTLNLLQGTEYMPNLRNTILFIEDDDLVQKNFIKEFNRNLQSLLQQPDAKNISGIVFGRFQKKCYVKKKQLIETVRSISALSGIPIIAGADFGHTTPQCTFPIGGKAKIVADEKNPSIMITAH